MIPISEYATVQIGTTMLDALHALERAQKEYKESKYHHRAILVLDGNGRVVGKISQLRILRAITPELDFDSKNEELQKYKFSDTFITSLREQYRVKGKTINKETLLNAAAKKVEEFMQKPTPGEFVSEDASLDTAIQKLVAETHLGLLVTRDGEIVGILRISDVFQAVYQEMTALKKKSNK